MVQAVLPPSVIVVIVAPVVVVVDPAAKAMVVALVRHCVHMYMSKSALCAYVHEKMYIEVKRGL